MDVDPQQQQQQQQHAEEEKEDEQNGNTPVLGPMPRLPALQTYTVEQVYGASTEELREMVWQMSESMANLNQFFDDVMSAQLRREAVLLERLHQASR